MSAENNNQGEGLFQSLKSLIATLVDIVHTRLELISTDLEEGRERLISLLVMAFVSLFCLCFGIVLLAILLVVVFWDTHRLLVLSSLTAVFFVAGLWLCVLAIRALKAMPRMFAASLAELSKDHQQLDADN
ncbi:MAG: phage holin family protein [Methylotenera sp.]|nr:phage holin family protein [Methylotenera sp.]MDP1755330.1 phage holin family protein [Methylotenera sp.]MDP1958842.1 phage holin family protein [Methylotenera sp.]MDP2101796.1 phage holin family protein [Methylotenera sp.]MDP2280498.1 phage holin family protein [Methylotenera sp.]